MQSPTIAFECQTRDEQKQVTRYLDGIDARTQPDAETSVVVVHGGDATKVETALAALTN